MISNTYGIIREIVKHLRNKIRMFSILVGTVLKHSALQVVAIVQKDEPVT